MYLSRARVLIDPPCLRALTTFSLLRHTYSRRNSLNATFVYVYSGAEAEDIYGSGAEMFESCGDDGREIAKCLQCS
jgi:hypothetical protein